MCYLNKPIRFAHWFNVQKSMTQENLSPNNQLDIVEMSEHTKWVSSDIYKFSVYSGDDSYSDRKK